MACLDYNRRFDHMRSSHDKRVKRLSHERLEAGTILAGELYDTYKVIFRFYELGERDVIVTGLFSLERDTWLVESVCVSSSIPVSLHGDILAAMMDFRPEESIRVLVKNQYTDEK